MIIPPPQPGQTHLHQLFTDPSQSYAREIANAGQARARVRTVLKANRKDAQAGASGDWTAALNVSSCAAGVRCWAGCGASGSAGWSARVGGERDRVGRTRDQA